MLEYADVLGLINNPWFTGIGGGIASGFFVFFITRWLFSDKSRKEYLREVTIANREVLVSVRQGIPEGVPLDGGIVKTLTLATARKFNVRDDDMFSNEQIAEELIKEVMDSSFISAETKRNYCLMISELKDAAFQSVDAMRENSAWKSKSDGIIPPLAAILGITTGATTVFLTASNLIGDMLNLADLQSIIVPLFGAAVAVIASLAGFAGYRRADRELRISEFELPFEEKKAELSSKE